jgi:DNA-binding winged helix-turn-helix (wHTH) protein
VLDWRHLKFEVPPLESRIYNAQVVRFATFEVDLRSGEVRKGGVKLKLSGQPFQVLAILLERPGEIVTREELQKRLWPDTFVDVDHNLNTAINKIREVLSDSAESPRFVETLPRRGYRFVAPVEGTRPTEVTVGSRVRQESRMPWVHRTSILFVILVLLAVVGFFIYRRLQSPASLAQRTLTRLTFDDGLQIGATWSPDGRFIAYSSNRGGKFDIWVQQVSGGDPVQITTGSRTGHPMANTSRIVPKTARAVCTLCPHWAARDWNEGSHRSGITLDGHPTARKFCSRPILRVWMSRTDSTCRMLTEAPRVRCFPISFHSTSSAPFQPRGIPMAIGSLYGWGGMGPVQTSGQYQLGRASQSDLRLPPRL